MGACQSQTSGSAPFVDPVLDRRVARGKETGKSVATVKTPGRVLTSSNIGVILSPSEETNSTVPVSLLHGSFSDKNSSFSSAAEEVFDQSWNSLPADTSEFKPYSIYYSSAFSVDGDNSKVTILTEAANGTGLRRSSLGCQDEGDETQIHSENTVTSENLTYRAATPLVASRQLPSTILVPDSSISASVDPQTIANFHLLKIQAEQAAINPVKNRRKAKLKDLREDVQGYRNLWIEFENMKHQAEDSPKKEVEEMAKTASVINLRDPASWYVDFTRIHTIDGTDDDNSISSASILSEVITN